MGFIPLTFIDVIDILLVASLFYGAYRAMKGTSAPYIMIGIFVIYLVWILVKTFNLVLFSSILGQIISVGVIAILIIFQPEIRHFLQAIGRQRGRFEWLSRIFNFRNRRAEQEIDLEPLVVACQEMGAEKVGALIIIKQVDDLNVVVESGIRLDAKLSTSLLENIFFKNAPLHDGGVVISGDRIVAAKCVLPSTQQEVPKSYGMRHRAALGMSEVSDAIVIAVSEETGRISLAHDSVIKRNIDPQNLAQAIRKLMRQNDRRRENSAE
ncbi:MAG: diadenylate cyclase CdaA [Alistipes sp.]|nr:diadenylate cyclase CdaA [Alistipes sp.]MBO7263331.1 diadenylate cyclase CdaA [Alistipes sp.]